MWPFRRETDARTYAERGPSVLVCVIAKGEVDSRCLASIHGQDYADFGVLTHSMKARPHGSHAGKSRCANIIRNRNYVRQMALATDADWYLLVDSDVVLPTNAISQLTACNLPFLCGWYPVRSGRNWSAGIIRGGQLYVHRQPQPGVVVVDSAGLGCALIARRVLEGVAFRDGCRVHLPLAGGGEVFVDDSTQFCLDAAAAGWPPMMCGDVICEHHSAVFGSER